jgi:glycosyltransferase involved in cell wall biosynthesis
MPVLNEEEYVGEQLAALARQTYEGAWELVVVDNGCTDRSLETVHSLAGQLPSVMVVDATSCRGLSYAKNLGIAWANGDLYAFCDADDVATPGWLEALVSAAAHADVVGGAFDFTTLNDPLRQAWRPETPSDGLEIGFSYLPYVPGGNCAVWASVALALGWNETFGYGGDDQDFSWRAQLASYRLAFAGEAVVQLRFRRRLGDHARQWYSYGKAGPSLYRTFRQAGMPRSDPRHAAETWRWLLARSGSLARSSARRGNWVRLASFSVGRVIGSVRARTVFL